MTPQHPVATLLLRDLREAAAFLDDLAAETSWPNTSRAAHQHAVRLGAACQVVERLMGAIETTIAQAPPPGEVTPGVAP